MSQLVVCPACRAQLIVGSELVGQSITCGSCQQVFEATAAPPPPPTAPGPPPLPTDLSRVFEPTLSDQLDYFITRPEKEGLRSVGLGLTFVHSATWMFAVVAFTALLGVLLILGKDLLTPFSSGKLSLVSNLPAKKAANVVLFGGCIYLLVSLAQTLILVGLICCWGVPKTKKFAKARPAIIFSLLFFAAAMGIDVSSLLLTILIQGRTFVTEHGVHPCVTSFVMFLRVVALIQFLTFLREVMSALEHKELVARLGRLYWSVIVGVLVLLLIAGILLAVGLATSNSEDPAFALGALRIAIALSCTLYNLGAIFALVLFVHFLILLKYVRAQIRLVLETPQEEEPDETEE